MVGNLLIWVDVKWSDLYNQALDILFEGLEQSSKLCDLDGDGKYEVFKEMHAVAVQLTGSAKFAFTELPYSSVCLVPFESV